MYTQNLSRRFRAKPLAGLAGLGLLAATAPLAAQTSQLALEEVVVTAQKRVEGYLDVPVAVSTLSGEVLDVAKVTEFQDLVQVSPSLTFNQSGDQRGVGILIRGIGTTAFQTAVEPTVSTVVDGVTMGRTAQFISDLADIERVEILRGPQGTLFGKNASAGLINIITKRPTNEFEASVRGTVTDDDGWGLNASVSGPLTDSMRGRLAAYSKTYDGFAENLYTGKTINGDDSWGTRGKLEIDLGDRASVLLIADYSKQERNCCALLQDDVNGNRFYEYDYGRYGIELGEENNKTLDAQDGFSNTETSGISAEFNVDFDAFVFTSITAYRGFELESNQGVDGLPYDTPTYGRFLFNSNGAYRGGNQEQSQFSQELRITTSAWDTVQMTAGLFYWEQTVDRYFERETWLCTTPASDDLSLSPDPAQTPCESALHGQGYFDSSVDTENVAAFGQVDWRFLPDWTATLGLRYTRDDISVEFDRVTASPGPAVAPSGSGANETDETDLSGKAALQWDINDEIMMYASYAEGYKAPAFNLIFGATPESIEEAVPPETSEAWEMGVKAELFERRLRLGLTAFHTQFDDLQGQATPPGEISFILTSAGTAITKGVEFDFTAKPLPNLLINGGVAYVDAYYDKYPGAQCYMGQTAAEGCVDGVQDLAGAQIANAPQWKYSLQTRYDIQLDTPFDMFISGNYRWQDEAPGEANNSPLTYHDDYGVLDLNLGLEADDGRWSAQWFIKNALDDHYVDLKSSFSLHGGVVHYLSRDAERYMGLEMEYRFGAF